MTKFGTSALGFGFALLAIVLMASASSKTSHVGQPVDTPAASIEIAQDPGPGGNDAAIQGRKIEMDELIRLVALPSVPWFYR